MFYFFRVHHEPVFLTAVDEHGNKTTLQTKINASIEAADEMILSNDIVLPALENNCSEFKMKGTFLTPIVKRLRNRTKWKNIWPEGNDSL